MYTLNREFLLGLYKRLALREGLRLEDNKIIETTKRGKKKVFIDFQEDYLKFGGIKIYYSVKNLDELGAMIDTDLKAELFSPSMSTLFEFRTGKVGRDYPDLSMIRGWMESIDNPLLDDSWCYKNNISVNYSEFPGGISFLVLAEDLWILDNISEMCERKYEKFLVERKTGPRYCGSPQFYIPTGNRYSCIRVIDEDWEKLKE